MALNIRQRYNKHMAKRFYIGTSGWHYNHWIGPFYTPGSKPKDFLAHYIKFFNTVELNNPFYHLPKPEVFKGWYKQTPKDFLFSVKASRYITHVKKLKDAKESVEYFLKSAKNLKEKLGPILFQLPPHWGSNPQRLEEFLCILPKKYLYTFELRDPSWFNDDIYKILRKYNAALCMYDFNGRLSVKEITADFVYLRFHGPGGKYRGKYQPKFLQEWAKDMKKWKIKTVYCYFDNDDSGFAVENAQELKQILKMKS
jgi:uncharacterized protein YecE (DUF72 family)